jgi:hypothetical protein
MTVYVAEINGRAIAAFNAENDIQAEGHASSKPFRGDLRVLENEGQPPWNVADEISLNPPYQGRSETDTGEIVNSELLDFVRARWPAGLAVPK